MSQNDTITVCSLHSYFAIVLKEGASNFRASRNLIKPFYFLFIILFISCCLPSWIFFLSFFVQICFSANINDRSLLGKRDSEIAVLVEDKEFVSHVLYCFWLAWLSSFASRSCIHGGEIWTLAKTRWFFLLGSRLPTQGRLPNSWTGNWNNISKTHVLKCWNQFVCNCVEREELWEEFTFLMS